MVNLLKMKETFLGNTLSLQNLNNENKALIVVDMVNGFVKKGNLASPRINSIVTNIIPTIPNFYN